jgi:hypothetical protein
MWVTPISLPSSKFPARSAVQRLPLADRRPRSRHVAGEVSALARG